MDVRVGDKLQMKKPHPCGTNVFEVLRIGANFMPGFFKLLDGFPHGIAGNAERRRKLLAGEVFSAIFFKRV